MDPITSLGMTLGAGLIQNQLQQGQQKDLMRLQIEGQKEMGKYNQELAIDTWNKTNYEAQVKHMKEAGLNPGLLYGGGGGGGATAQSAPGSVTGATAAPMQIGLGIELMQAQSNIELQKSQAELNKAQANKLAGVDTQEGLSRIEKLKADTNLSVIQGKIGEFEAGIKAIEMSLNQTTFDEVVRKISLENEKLAGEAEKAKNEGKLSTEGYNETLKQIQQTSIEQQIRMSLMKADILKTGAETKETYAKISRIQTEMEMMYKQNEQRWKGLELQERKLTQEQEQILINKLQQEFNTSTPNQIKQWIDLQGALIKNFSQAVGAVM